MRTRWLSSPGLRRATDRAEGLTVKEISAAVIGTDSVFSTGSTSRNQPIAPRNATISPTTLTAAWVTNPALNTQIDWIWFVASQVAFGMVTGYVVAHTKTVETVQTWPLAARAGIEAPGITSERRSGQ